MSMLMPGAAGPPQPWTWARVGKVAATTAAVGGGVAGLAFAAIKLAGVPATEPSSSGKLIPPEDAAWLDAHTGLREICDRMMLFAGFNRAVFIQLVAACAKTARFVVSLDAGILPYSPAVPRQLAHYTQAIEELLKRFQARIPLKAREEYMCVDGDMDTVLDDIRSNVQLQTRHVMETAALARGSLAGWKR